MENNNQPNDNNHLTDPATMPSASPAPVPGAVYGSGGQNYTTNQIPPQKTRSKKLLWGCVFVGILVIIGVVVFLWANRSKPHKTSTKNIPAATIPKAAAPLVTTSAPATLKPGTYTVGPDKNILPGIYSIAPGVQQSGNFTLISPTSNFSVVLNDNATGAGSDTRVGWAQLSDGDKVQISGGNLTEVHFKAVVMSPSSPPALAKLYDNTVTVTDTPNRVNPGKYFITDTNDTNAFIMVIDKNYNLKYNAPLNGTGFHAVLEDGDQIATINMTSYNMKPE